MEMFYTRVYYIVTPEHSVRMDNLIGFSKTLKFYTRTERGENIIIPIFGSVLLRRKNVGNSEYTER